MATDEASINEDWGVLITARLKSQRLPRKVLKDLDGKPMLWHLIQRMNSVIGSAGVTVITSHLPGDDELQTYCEENGVDVFRGHPDDVMVRMRDAAIRNRWRHFISCTADNPFVDPLYASRLMAFHLRKKNALSCIRGLPFGVFSYAVSLQGLEDAIDSKLANDTEVWGVYFTEHPDLVVGYFGDIAPGHARPELRLTVDEEDDHKLIQAILNSSDSAVPSLDEIINVIDRIPALKDINSSINQKSAPAPKFRQKRRISPFK